MLVLLVGALGGVFIGASGVGAGSIITPLLILLGYSPAEAVSTGFFVLIVAKSFGSAIHLKLGHWPGRDALTVLAGGVAGVLLASMLLAGYTAHGGAIDSLVKRILGVTLVAGSLAALAVVRRQRAGSEHSLAGSWFALIAIGAVVGALVCLTSAGSGALLLLLLLPVTSWSVAELAAVSNVFGLTTGAISLGVYSRMTAIDWSSSSAQAWASSRESSPACFCRAMWTAASSPSPSMSSLCSSGPLCCSTGSRAGRQVANGSGFRDDDLDATVLLPSFGII